MSQYNDLYIRDALGDTGIIPCPAGIVCQCPDIIPAGTSPTPDPQGTYTANYNQNPGLNIEFGQYNYIYVRVKNLASQASAGQVKLYYVPSNILSMPKNWVNNQVPNINDTNTGTFDTINPGEIGVVKTPFYWNPPEIPRGYHFCLVAQIITAAHPNPIPVNDDVIDFNAWIRETGGAAFRNITVANVQPDVGQQWLLDMENPQADPALYVIVAECRNIPAGSKIEIVSPVEGPNPPLNYSENIQGDMNPSTSTTLPAKFPPNKVIVTYTPGGPGQATIVVSYYLTGDGPPITDSVYAQTAAEIGIDAVKTGLTAAHKLVKLADYTFFVQS